VSGTLRQVEAAKGSPVAQFHAPFREKRQAGELCSSGRIMLEIVTAGLSGTLRQIEGLEFA
jgi:hypothetical protein